MRASSCWHMFFFVVAVAGMLELSSCTASHVQYADVDAENDVDGSGDEDAGQACPDIYFTSLSDGEVFGLIDDERPNEPGFQHTLEMTTTASRGSTVSVFTDGLLLVIQVEVASTIVRFPTFMLLEGTHNYQARVDGFDCHWPEVTVTVDTVSPSCEITDPVPDVSVLTVEDDEDHIAPGLQSSFSVVTDDGEPIEIDLIADGRPVGRWETGTGTARFESVSLNEGEIAVYAICTDGVGNEGMSPTRAFFVYSEPPDLRIVSPEEGQHLSYAADYLIEFYGLQVAVRVTSISSSMEGQRVCAQLAGSVPLDPYGCDELIDGDASLIVDLPIDGPVTIEANGLDTHGVMAAASVDVTIDL